MAMNGVIIHQTSDASYSKSQSLHPQEAMEILLFGMQTNFPEHITNVRSASDIVIVEHLLPWDEVPDLPREYNSC